MIFFVDDDALVRSTTSDLLRMRGLDVEEFENGSELLAAVQAGCPEAVLIDINMPGMDGFEVARRIRSHCGPTLRLIAFSGVTSDEQRMTAVTAGFDLFVAKPASSSTLLRALLPRSEALGKV